MEGLQGSVNLDGGKIIALLYQLFKKKLSLKDMPIYFILLFSLFFLKKYSY